MGKDVLIKYKSFNMVTYFIRLVCLVLIVYILTQFNINPSGFTVLIIFLLIIFLLSSVKRICIYKEYIEFSSQRLLPIFNRKHIIKFEEIQKVSFKEKEINYLTLMLPGVGSIRDAMFIFVFKNGKIKEQPIRGTQTKLKEMYKVLIREVEKINK